MVWGYIQALQEDVRGLESMAQRVVVGLKSQSSQPTTGEGLLFYVESWSKGSALERLPGCERLENRYVSRSVLVSTRAPARSLYYRVPPTCFQTESPDCFSPPAAVLSPPACFAVLACLLACWLVGCALLRAVHGGRRRFGGTGRRPRRRQRLEAGDAAWLLCLGMWFAKSRTRSVGSGVRHVGISFRFLPSSAVFTEQSRGTRT